MPGASFHSFYWSGSADSGAQTPIGSSASGGYVPWMTTVTIVSMLCLAARVSWSAR